MATGNSARALKNAEEKESNVHHGELLDRDDNFVLERREYPFTLEDPETGVKTKYMLKEMNGLGRDQYLNCLIKRTKTTASGQSSLSDMKGLQADLLTRCMRNMETGELVDEKFVQHLPAHILTRLFEKARELSALGKEDDEEAKN